MAIGPYLPFQLTTLWMLLPVELYVNGIIQYACFWVWLLQLTVMFGRCIHAVMCVAVYSHSRTIV